MRQIATGIILFGITACGSSALVTDAGDAAGVGNQDGAAGAGGTDAGATGADAVTMGDAARGADATRGADAAAKETADAGGAPDAGAGGADGSKDGDRDGSAEVALTDSGAGRDGTAACQPPSADTVFVDARDGNDATATGSAAAGCQFRSISAALAFVRNNPAFTKIQVAGALIGADYVYSAASTGEVFPLRLDRAIEVSVPVGLRASIVGGSPKGASCLDATAGGKKGRAACAVAVTAAAQLAGFSSIHNADGAGVLFGSASSGATLQRVGISQCAGDNIGVFAGPSDFPSVTIGPGVISTAGGGSNLHVSSGASATVVGSAFLGAATGSGLGVEDAGTSVLVSGLVTFSGNAVGIVVGDASHLVVRGVGNSALLNGVGISVLGGAPTVEIADAAISNGVGVGMLVAGDGANVAVKGGAISSNGSHGVVVALAPNHSLRIDGTKIVDNGGSGVWFQAVSGTTQVQNAAIHGNAEMGVLRGWGALGKLDLGGGVGAGTPSAGGNVFGIPGSPARANKLAGVCNAHFTSDGLSVKDAKWLSCPPTPGAGTTTKACEGGVDYGYASAMGAFTPTFSGSCMTGS